MPTVRGKQTQLFLVAAVLITASVTTIFQSSTASAAQIVSRSLTLRPGATDGGSKPSGVVNHDFAFTLPGGSSVGSIRFLYCTTASGTCATPTGLATTGAGVTLGAETGATGFTLNKVTNGSPYLTRAAAAVAANQAVTYRLDGVTNPSATNQTFFVRISTFASTDTTGAATDTGTVTASTATQIVLTGTMPESLIFCTGATISTTGGQPDCTTATAGTISFNQLFSPTDTASASSQMAASTNATTGYNITVAGATLTSGANTIPAMAAAAVGTRGTGQFGMNLRANTVATSTPAVGADVAPASNVPTAYRANPSTGYAVVDTFKFTSGDSVAKSDFGGSLGPTNSQIYTASYIVNVSGAQTAGTYTTTLTYVCTATY